MRPEETPVAFTVSLMRKDLELALRLAEDVGVEMRATRAADEMLERACEVELEDADFASVAQVIESNDARSVTFSLVARNHAPMTV